MWTFNIDIEKPQFPSSLHFIIQYYITRYRYIIHLKHNIYFVIMYKIFEFYMVFCIRDDFLMLTETRWCKYTRFLFLFLLLWYAMCPVENGWRVAQINKVTWQVPWHDLNYRSIQSKFSFSKSACHKGDMQVWHAKVFF